MDFFDYLPLLAGIGMFLFGMNMLAASIEKLAGAKLESLLERLTSNKWKGLALGTGVTAIIQSSAATSVTVIGFVNAGIMTLAQALPVVFGANIGSTATAQLLRLGDLEGAGVLLNLLKPKNFSPIIIIVGAVILLMSKTKKSKNIAELLIGFGILFWGMNVMESTLSPLSESEMFRSLFTAFTNPLIGILVGILITSLIQSSSASVGILQALSSTGVITFAVGYPLLLGMNIGKCLTVFLASFGTNRNSKRVVYSHLFFNVFGAIVFAVVFYGLNAIFNFGVMDTVLDRGGIANLHTGFNLIVALLLMPCIPLINKLTDRIVPKGEEKEENHALDYLDNSFLKTPAFALDQCVKVIDAMADALRENLATTRSMMLEKYDIKKLGKMNENEHFLDKCQSVMGEYLVRINRESLHPADAHRSSEIQQTLMDYERIGDYCINVVEIAEYMNDNNAHFTEVGKRDAELLFDAITEITETTFRAFDRELPEDINNIEPLEEVVDQMETILKNHHMQRLKEGTCTVDIGLSFIEMLSNMERISDHCSNVGVYIVEKRTNLDNFDRHEYQQLIHSGVTPGYQKRYEGFQKKYIDPLKEENV